MTRSRMRPHWQRCTARRRAAEEPPLAQPLPPPGKPPHLLPKGSTPACCLGHLLLCSAPLSWSQSPQLPLQPLAVEMEGCGGDSSAPARLLCWGHCTQAAWHLHRYPRLRPCQATMVLWMQCYSFERCGYLPAPSSTPAGWHLGSARAGSAHAPLAHRTASHNPSSLHDSKASPATGSASSSLEVNRPYSKPQTNLKCAAEYPMVLPTLL
mmetsp:Transcript_67043/g.160687  ORF Transcript_67043/g.160687 Transcript_67043/m.160687 type:complete len:210 (+) Transcript_67043:1832-2461(+)